MVMEGEWGCGVIGEGGREGVKDEGGLEGREASDAQVRKVCDLPLTWPAGQTRQSQRRDCLHCLDIPDRV